MDPFLRLLQITLITTRIYQSHAKETSLTIASTTSLTAPVTSNSTLNSSSVNSSSTINSALSLSSFLSSSQLLSTVETIAVGTTENTALLQPQTMSGRLSTSTTSGEGNATLSSPGQTGESKNTEQSYLSASPRPTANVALSQTLSTGSEKSTTTGVGTTSAVMQASSVSAQSTQSTSQKSQQTVVTSKSSEKSSKSSAISAFAQSTQSASQKSQKTVVTSKSSESSQPPRASQVSRVTDKSKEPASHTSTVSESTNATSVSHSGSFSRQTHYMTANYSSSSASLQRSIDVTTVPTTTAASSPVQSLTPSPVSLNWTDWSVGKKDCKKYCSEKGGTVTASRQCFSHSVTTVMLDDNDCTKHNISTKEVVKCDGPYCPISGTEALRGSIFNVPVGISLILLTKFVGG